MRACLAGGKDAGGSAGRFRRDVAAEYVDADHPLPPQGQTPR